MGLTSNSLLRSGMIVARKTSFRGGLSVDTKSAPVRII